MKNLFKLFIAIGSLTVSFGSVATQPGDHKKNAEIINPQAQLEAFRDNYLAFIKREHAQAYKQNPDLFHQDLQAHLINFAHSLADHNPGVHAFFASNTASASARAGAGTASTATAAAGTGADSKSAAAESQTKSSNSGLAVASTLTAAAGSSTATATAVQPSNATAATSSGDSKASMKKQNAEQIRPIAFIGSYICVSNNYQYAITISTRGALDVYDLKSQQSIYHIKSGVKPESAGFACDDTAIYFKLDNGTVAIYTMNDKKNFNVVGSSVKTSANGKWLAISSDGMNTAQKDTTLIYLPTLITHRFQGTMGEFSPSSKRFFFYDQTNKIVIVNLTEQNSQVNGDLTAQSVEFVGDVRKIKIHRNDQTFVVNDNLLYSLDLAKLYSLAGKVTICANGDIVSQEQQKFSLMNSQRAFKVQNTEGIFMDITADGSRILLHRDNKVFERVISSGAEQLIGESTFPEAQYTLDGSHVMLRSYEGDLQFISLTTKQSILSLKGITRADFSTDYSLMALESRNHVFVYNPKDGKFIQRVEGAFLSFENNILITAGNLVGDNDRYYYVYDFKLH